MNLQNIIIIAVATLIGLGYLYKIRSYDIYEKEPFWILLIVAIAGGIISILCSLFIYEFVEVRRNFIDAIMKVGVIEEFSKLIALLIIFPFIKKNFNEIVDGIIYITAISLGFSIIENIFYALKSEVPYLTLFMRSIISVVGHISFSGYMGIAFYIHIRIHKNYLGLILSFIFAAFAHGFYDGFIFHQELLFLFRFIFVGLITLQFWLYRTTLGFSNFKEILTINSFRQSNKSAFLYCTKCDLSVKSNELVFWKIKAGICPNCKNLIMNVENLVNLLKYYRPIKKYQKILNDLPKNDRITSFDEEKKILYNIKRNYLSANLNDLSLWLDKENKNDRTEILNIPFIGFLFKNLGLKYFNNN